MSKKITTSRNCRKAFTIVELIIVIAVIGILAAILIPTFASIIKKATISECTSNAKNLNTAIASELAEMTSGTYFSLDQALVAVAKAGFPEKNIKTDKEGIDIVWVPSFNKFAVITGEKGAVMSTWKVVYPTEISEAAEKDPTFLTIGNLQSTNRVIKADDTVMNTYAAEIEGATAATPKTVTVDSAIDLASLAALSSAFDADGNATKANTIANDFANVTIELNSDLYIGGTIWTPFGEQPTKPFMGSINGNGHSIYGLTNKGYDGGVVFTTSSTKTTGSAYGLIAYPGNGVTVKNLNMENVSIDMVNEANPNDASNGLCVGAIIGYAKANAQTIVIENCTVSGSVRGVNDIGGLIGKFYGRDLTMTNCTNNADILAELGGKTVKAGGLCGYISYAGNKTFENCTNNGAVTTTSRNGTHVALAGGLFGGSGSPDVVLTVKDFENNGTITASSGETKRLTGQIAGQGSSNNATLSGTIKLSGSTPNASVYDPYLEQDTYSFNYICNVNIAGVNLFGLFHSGKFNIGNSAADIMYTAGATINGISLEDAQFECSEYHIGVNQGSVSYSFTVAA